MDRETYKIVRRRIINNSNILGIIKLGGSVITTSEGKFHDYSIIHLALQISELSQPLIIVHGGGYPIKLLLKKFKVHSDFINHTKTDVIWTLKKTFRSINTWVIKKFNSESINCKKINPADILEFQNGKITLKIDKDKFINELFSLDVIYVLYAGVFEDKTRQLYYIPSSDQVVALLAKYFSPEFVLFLTDVDGVYPLYPPANSHEKPLKSLDYYFLAKQKKNYLFQYGEIYDKVRYALECAKYSRYCYIINGKKRFELSDILTGTAEIGTRILSSGRNKNE